MLKIPSIIQGSWSASVGPNAPLNDTCAPPSAQQGSAVSAVKSWTSAGIPANQLVLGVPAYGHSFVVTSENAFESNTSSVLKPYPPFDSTQHPLGDGWDSDSGGVDACGVPQNVGGNWNFWGLVDAGYLDAEGKNVTQYPYRFDTCSQTVSTLVCSGHQLVKLPPGVSLRRKQRN
jgi:chitinase